MAVNKLIMQTPKFEYMWKMVGKQSKDFLEFWVKYLRCSFDVQASSLPMITFYSYGPFQISFLFPPFREAILSYSHVFDHDQIRISVYRIYNNGSFGHG